MLRALWLVPFCSIFFVRCWLHELCLNARSEKLYDRLTTQIVSRMTLEDKTGQLIHVGMPGKTAGPAIRRELQKHRAGGVIYFGMNLGSREEIKKLSSDLQQIARQATGIPLFISTDQENGRVRRVDERTVINFPAALALGQTGDARYAHDTGFFTGYRLRDVGINMVLAPVLDINNNPGNPVINTRSFGSSTETVSSMGVALMQGLSKAGSTATIKHYPGHGDTTVDSHLALPSIHKDLPSLEAFELVPFKKAIASGAEVVMSAHILFQALDKEYPATLSPKILKEILRERLGYRGLIMTDAMEMHAIAHNYSRKKAARLAFQAGIDIILLTSLGSIVDEIYDSLLSGFKDGALSVTDLDQAVSRQVRLKLKKGLLDAQVLRERFAVSEKDAQLLTEIHTKNQQLIDKEFQNILTRYQEHEINTRASRAAISSLRKVFPGIKNKETIGFFYNSVVLYNTAKQQLKPTQIRPLSWSTLRSSVVKNPHSTFIVEVPPHGLSHWNELVLAHKRSTTNRQEAGQLIGLYAGNPFARIAVPEAGAMIVSLSDSRASVVALLERILDGQPIKKADLILPD
ncbi:MAG: hypothetical protein HS115_18140 [Spirochaetales bacterium]|nr:hypothetical protein [Spirochaetales bacterium]